MKSEKKTIEYKFSKKDIPRSYYATPEEVERLELRSAKPSSMKDKNGHYINGRIVSVRYYE